MRLVLESERLLLRPLVETDVDVEIEMGRDPDVMRYAGAVESADEIARNMRKYVRRCAGGRIGVWCVTDRSTGEKLGSAIFLPLPVDVDDTDWDLVTGDEFPDGEIEVGYMLKRSAWGRGYATEAARRLLRFAFEETPLEDVVATTHPEHRASRRVLEKCGLIYEGMRRAYATECCGFRMTRQQWVRRTSGAG